MGAKTLAAVMLVIAAGVVGGLYLLSAPNPVNASSLPQHVPDPANGEVMYNAGGCISCHKPAAGQGEGDATLPSGGVPFNTPAGTFYPPNITPDRETGIGAWSDANFVNAVQHGISPDGTHYIPAFPYSSYGRMRVEDVLDLKAYLFSLPAVKGERRPPEVMLGSVGEAVMRRATGLWKLLRGDARRIVHHADESGPWNRGAYLVDAPGHCGECHTPRNFLMIPIASEKFQGGPHPEGKGKVPSLIDLVGRKRYKDADDLANALQFGETFGYDKLSSGGMGAVQTNLSKLPEGDIKAIATYLVGLTGSRQ
jgi:mono/diheme cytochrome c family protein